MKGHCYGKGSSVAGPVQLGEIVMPMGTDHFSRTAGVLVNGDNVLKRQLLQEQVQSLWQDKTEHLPGLTFPAPGHILLLMTVLIGVCL